MVMPRPVVSLRGTPWRWAGWGALLGAAATLVLQAPAHWLAQTLRQISGGQVQLRAAQGTLWNGSAVLVLAGGADSHDQAALPGRVHWQLRPAWIGMQIRLSADCCTSTPLQGRSSIGWGRANLALADSQSRWPAALLSGLGTPWNTVQLQGQLQLSTQGLALSWAQGRMQWHGQARLDLLDISSRLATLRPIGSYRLQLAADEGARLTLSTLDGALRLSGNGQWIGQRLRFVGEATAAPGREAALANLLNIIGRRTGSRSVITIG